MAEQDNKPKRYRPHQREYQRAWRSKNRVKLREKKRDYMRKYRAKNREKVNAFQRKRYHINGGDSPAQRRKRALLKATDQRNRELLAARPKPDVCDACGETGGGRIVFDHCHKRNHFRGWLCDDCNVALGRVQDNPARLLKLIAYLERTKDSQSTQFTFPGL